MFLAGIYCRVSVEETDKEGAYSNSIDSQMKIAEGYILEQRDMTVVGKYVDDGASGSNFDRPQFRRMLADIESGKINTVIIKDVSRLGREHIGTNYYLGKYFPERGIRVLSLLDHYDSQTDPYDEMLDIKTLMNDMYLWDISKKIKSVIQIKRSMGEYTPKEPPYGYIKSKTAHNHLEIDPYASEVVRRIYRMYLKGYGYSVISRVLNEDGILCPSRYKKEVLKTGYPYPTGRGLWTNSSVTNILKNPVYTGAIVLRKTERLSYKLKDKKVIPLSERQLCENAHEPIISKEEFEHVQQIRESHKVSCFNNTTYAHKYSGLLFCGKCGYSMQKRYLASRGGYDGYMCGSHREIGKDYCVLNHITFERLDEIVAFAISQQIKNVRGEWKELERYVAGKKDISVRQMETLQARTEKNRWYCKKAYEQYMDEALTKEEYLDLKAMYDAKNSRYHAELEKLSQEIHKAIRTAEETMRWLGEFSHKRVAGKQLTRELLKELIQRIKVYPDGNIDIQFCFRASQGKSQEGE